MISIWELLLIAIVAITVLKPEQLGVIFQALGKGYAWLRSSEQNIETFFNKHVQLSINSKAAEEADKQYQTASNDKQSSGE